MQITQLTTSSTLASTDVLVKETIGGTTQGITAAQFAAAVKALASLVNTTEMNAAIQQFPEPLAWNNGTKPTLSNGSHYSYGTYYWKRGGLVYLCISAEFSSAPTNALLFTLPTGYRPIGNAEITVSGGGSYNAKAQCRITDGGAVYVTSVDKWVIGSGLFIYAT